MILPLWLLRILPMWDYICPKCKREVPKKSNRCPHCREQYGIPLRVPPKILKDKKALEKYVHKHVFPKVSQQHREYLTQFFTVIFSDGFETGDFSKWTGSFTVSGGTLGVNSSNPHSGTYNAWFTLTGNVYAVEYKDFGSSYASAYARCYVKFTALPTSGKSLTLMEFNTHGNNFLAGIGLGYSGGATWRSAYNKNTVVTLKYAGSPAINTWYCIEMELVISSSAGSVSYWIDGTQQAALEDSGFKNDNYGNLQRLFIGADRLTGDTSYAVSAYVDDVVVADAYIGLQSASISETGTEGFTYQATIPLSQSSIESFTYQATIPLLQSSIEGFTYAATIPLLESSIESGAAAVASLTQYSVEGFTYTVTIPLLQSSTEAGAAAAASLTQYSVENFTYTATIPLLEFSVEGFSYAVTIPLIQSSVEGFTYTATIPLTQLSVEGFTYTVTIPLLESSSEAGSIAVASLTEYAVEGFTYSVTIPLLQSSIEGFTYTVTIPLLQLATESGAAAAASLTQYCAEGFTYTATIPLLQSSIEEFIYSVTVPLLQPSTEGFTYTVTIPLLQISLESATTSIIIPTIYLNEYSVETGLSATTSITLSTLQNLTWMATIPLLEFSSEAAAVVYMKPKIFILIGNLAINIATGQIEGVILE